MTIEPAIGFGIASEMEADVLDRSLMPKSVHFRADHDLYTH